MNSPKADFVDDIKSAGCPPGCQEAQDDMLMDQLITWRSLISNRSECVDKNRELQTRLR